MDPAETLGLVKISFENYGEIKTYSGQQKHFSHWQTCLLNGKMKAHWRKFAQMKGRKFEKG